MGRKAAQRTICATIPLKLFVSVQSELMNRLLRGALALSCLILAVDTCQLSAQAVRYDYVASTTSGQCAPGVQCPLLVLPGTQVNVCATANAATLASCLASPATTYTTTSAGTPCPTTAQLTPQAGGSCTAYSDSQGNYGFWGLAGLYSYYLRVPATAGGGTYGPFPLNIGSSTGCPSNATCDANYATLPLACTAAGTGTLYVSRTWTGLTTQTLSCPMTFLATGILKPASGQTVTLSGVITAASTQQIFDVSAGGTIAVTGGQTGYADWFGSAAGNINAALSAGFVPVILGAETYTYTSANTPNLAANQHLIGAGQGKTILNQTSVSSAVTLTDASYASLESLSVQSAGDGVGLVADSSGSALFPAVNNVAVIATGSAGACFYSNPNTGSVYFATFRNDICNPASAPAVGTRIGYDFSRGGTGGAGTYYGEIIGGTVDNVLKGFYATKGGALKVESVAVNGTTNGANGGIVVEDALEGDEYHVQVENSTVDTLLQLDSGAYRVTFSAPDLSGLGGAAGTVNTSGTAMTYVSGTNFSTAWVNIPVTINSVANTIASCSSITACTLGTSAGTQSGVSWSDPASQFIDNSGYPTTMTVCCGSPFDRYGSRQNFLENVTMGTGAVLSLPGTANGLQINGTISSTQLGGVGNLFPCVAVNGGFCEAIMEDNAQRALLFVTQGYSPTTNGDYSSSQNASTINSSKVVTGSAILWPYAFTGGIIAGNNQDGSGGTPFGSLSSSAPNGTVLYCTTCKNVVDDMATAGAACLGSGSGSVARRENGRWDCN